MIADTVELISGILKVVILAATFAFGILKFRKHRASNLYLIFCFLLACEFVSEIYWQLNHVLKDRDYFSFLTAEDMGYLGLVLFGAAMLSMNGVRNRKKQIWILAVSYSALNAGILIYYTGRVFVESIEGLCLVFFLANIFHLISTYGYISKKLLTSLTAVMFLQYTLEYVMLFFEGRIYTAINVVCYVIWIAVLFTVIFLCVRAIHSKRPDALALACLTYTVTSLAAFLSSGMIFLFFDVMIAVGLALMLHAAGTEVAQE